MVPARTASWVAIALALSAVAALAFAALPGSAASAVEFALPLVLGLVILVIAIDAIAGRHGRWLDAACLVVYAAALGITIECVVVAAGIGSAAPGFLTAAVIFVAIAVAGASPIRAVGAGPCLLGSALIGLGVGWGVTAATAGGSAGAFAVMAIASVTSLGLVVRYRWRAMPIDPAGATTAGARPLDARDGVAAALVLYLGIVDVVLDLLRRVDRFMGGTREDPAWHARHGFPTDRRIQHR